MVDKQKQGKKNKAAGKVFEAKVRADLESKGWIVCKWANQVDLEKGKLCPVKPKFNPFTKSIIYSGTGFPDFVCFKMYLLYPLCFEVMGVECKGGKINKYLDKEEKAKCKWLLDSKIFGTIVIATRGTKRGTIQYDQFLRP